MSKARSFVLAALLLGAWAAPALAADKAPAASENAYAAAKSAEIETLKARASMRPNAGSGATLMEADDLLRRYRLAPAAEKGGLRAQLDAALARAEMEISSGR